jgi:GTP-binding protein
VLVHLVDVSSASGRDPVDDFETVRKELELFDPAFASKPQIVTANKIDAVDDEQRVKDLEKRAKKAGLPFFKISGVSGEGVPTLLEAMWTHLAEARDRDAADVEAELHSR